MNKKDARPSAGEKRKKSYVPSCEEIERDLRRWNRVVRKGHHRGIAAEIDRKVAEKKKKQKGN